MDAEEYKMIRDYLLTNLIPSTIKSDRKCRGIYLQDSKLMKVSKFSQYELMYLLLT